MTGPTIAPELRLPGLARQSWARTGVELRQFVRERDQLVFTFLYPVLLYVIFASVYGSSETVYDVPGTALAEGVPFAQYFLPGMIATGVFVSSLQNVAAAIAIERDDGTLRRLRATPMRPTAYFAGKIGQVLTVSLVQTAVLLAVAGLFYGVELPTDPARWATFAWVFLLGIASGTMLGIAYTAVIRSARSASAVVIAPVLVLQFISGVFFPFDQLPGWMQGLASVFPLKWLAQGMRSVFLPDHPEIIEASGSWQLGEGALVMALWLVAGLVVARLTFRWSRRDAG